VPVRAVPTAIATRDTLAIPISAHSVSSEITAAQKQYGVHQRMAPTCIADGGFDRAMSTISRESAIPQHPRHARPPPSRSLAHSIRNRSISRSGSSRWIALSSVLAVTFAGRCCCRTAFAVGPSGTAEAGAMATPLRRRPSRVGWRSSGPGGVGWGRFHDVAACEYLVVVARGDAVG
jgi:hypothetical protein